MSDTPWTRTIRRETGLIEHICKHGVGHPAFGSVDWMKRTTDQESWSVHGCDGCCHDDQWQLASLRESVEIANQIIVNGHQTLAYYRNTIKLQEEIIAELEERLDNQEA